MNKKKLSEIMPSNIGEYFKYEPATGKLVWKKLTRLNCRAQIGKEAGYLKGDRMMCISFRGLVFWAREIIWYLETGIQPKYIVNIKGKCSKIDNLRELTDKEVKFMKRYLLVCSKCTKSLPIKKFHRDNRLKHRKYSYTCIKCSKSSRAVSTDAEYLNKPHPKVRAYNRMIGNVFTEKDATDLSSQYIF